MFNVRPFNSHVSVIRITSNNVIFQRVGSNFNNLLHRLISRQTRAHNSTTRTQTKRTIFRRPARQTHPRVICHEEERDRRIKSPQFAISTQHQTFQHITRTHPRSNHSLPRNNLSHLPRGQPAIEINHHGAVQDRRYRHFHNVAHLQTILEFQHGRTSNNHSRAAKVNFRPHMVTLTTSQHVFSPFRVNITVTIRTLQRVSM